MVRSIRPCGPQTKILATYAETFQRLAADEDVERSMLRISRDHVDLIKALGSEAPARTA